MWKGRLRKGDQFVSTLMCFKLFNSRKLKNKTPIVVGLDIFIYTQSGSSLHKLWYSSCEVVVVVDMQQCYIKAHA